MRRRTRPHGFTGRSEGSTHINLRAVALVCSWANLGLEVFTDRQLDAVFGPSKHLAVA